MSVVGNKCALCLLGAAWLWCTSVQARESPLLAEAGEGRYAVVIGTNESDSPDTPRLRFADDDAIATRELLREAGVQTWLLTTLDEDSQRMFPDLKPDGPPTPEALYSVLADLAGRIGERNARGEVSEFFFFFSGHGSIERGQGYVVLQGGRLTRSDLHERVLKPLHATENHVIVDACKSYYLAFEKGVGGTRSLYPLAFVERSQPVSSTGFLLSTSSDRDSHEWERFGAGVFSYQVRSGLRGAADIDGDGRITYAELGAFLVTANSSIANPRFRPDFVVRPPENYAGGLWSELLRWPNGGETLVLDSPKPGHLYLETRSGERLLDVHPAEGENLSVHLPAGRPLFLRSADDRTEYPIESIGPVSLLGLTPQPVTIAQKGALNLAFERLFLVPFGRAALASYAASAQVQASQSSSGRPPRQVAREAAMWSTIGFTGLGATMNLLAHQRSLDRANGQDVGDINKSIDRLNAAAYVFWGLAGTALATWLTLTFWPESQGSPAFSVQPLISPQATGLGFSLPF